MNAITISSDIGDVNRPLHSLTPSAPVAHVPPQLPFPNDTTVVTGTVKIVFVVPNVVCSNSFAVSAFIEQPAQGARQYGAQVGAPRIRMVPIERK